MDNTITWINDDSYTDIFEIGKDEKWGVIDHLGNEIIPCIYDGINLSRGYHEPNEKTPIGVMNNKKEAFFDRKGNQLTEFYDDIDFWNEASEYFTFCAQDYSGILDYSGKELFRIKLADLKFLTNNVLSYKKDFKYGLINISGKILTEAIYENIRKISDYNFLAIKQNLKVEIIDIKEIL